MEEKEITVDITRTLTKHIAAIHNSASLNATQRKVMNIFLENALKDGFDRKIHKIPLSRLTKDLGWSLSSNVTDLLKEDLKSLASIQIEWNVLNKDKKNKWMAMQLLAEVGLENGEVSYAYPPTLKALLFNPNIYAKLNLETQKVLSTRYSVALWEIISGEFSIKQKDEVYTSWIGYEKVLKLLGLSNSVYEKRYSDFLRKVLNPAIEDINSKSEFIVDANINREGRKLVQISFKAVKKEISDTVLEISSDINIKTEDLKSRLELLGFSKRFINTVLNKYSYDEIDRAIDIYNHQIKSEKIKYPTAFFKKALEEGWFLSGVLEGGGTHPSSDLDIILQEINTLEEENICRQLRVKLFNQLGLAPYKNWIHPCKLTYSGKNLTVFVPSDFVQNWIESKFHADIQMSLQSLLPEGPIKISYDVIAAL